MNQDIFLPQMGFIFKCLGRKPDTEIVEFYWEALKHMEDIEFCTAVKNIMREFIPTSTNPFPLPAHFNKFTANDARGDAIRAVTAIKACIKRVGAYESVNFGDNTLCAVIESCGGWPAICTWTDQDWNINEGRILEQYQVLSQSRGTENGYRHNAGLHEKGCGYYHIHHVDVKKRKFIGSQRFCSLQLIETRGQIHASEYIITDFISFENDEICDVSSIVDNLVDKFSNKSLNLDK